MTAAGKCVACNDVSQEQAVSHLGGKRAILGENRRVANYSRRSVTLGPSVTGEWCLNIKIFLCIFLDSTVLALSF